MHRPLANDCPKGPASCKWLSEGTGLLPIINRRGRPFENNHWRGRPLVYDHGGTVNNNNNNDNNNNNNNNYNNNNYNNIKKCKRSSRGTNLLQMIICHPRHPSHLCQDPDLISQTFLKQFVLVSDFELYILRFPDSAFISINYSEWFFLLFFLFHLPTDTKIFRLYFLLIFPYHPQARQKSILQAFP